MQISTRRLEKTAILDISGDIDLALLLSGVGRSTLKMVDSKPAEPVPLRPGERRLPTAH